MAVDFAEILEGAQICRDLRVSAMDALKERLPGWEMRFESSAPDLSLLLLTNAAQKSQILAVHRHAWDDLEILNRILQEIKAVDQKVYQIAKISEHLVKTFILKNLQAECSLTIFGHGLGGSHAAEIYATLRKQVPKSKPLRVITFGQPLHPLGMSTKSAKKMPLVRVLVDKDPVTFLFVGTDPYGCELTLLPNGNFSVLSRPAKKAAPRFSPDSGREAVKSHTIHEYINKIRPKLDECVLVPTEKEA